MQVLYLAWKLITQQVVNGQGILNLGGDLGEHTIGGNISFTGDKGKVVTMPYTFKYNVVSAMKLLKHKKAPLICW